MRRIKELLFYASAFAIGVIIVLGLYALIFIILDTMQGFHCAYLGLKVTFCIAIQ